jgi:hypothetical protein
MLPFKLITASVLYAFLPISVCTYYWWRRGRRASEVRRVLDILKVDPEYAQIYGNEQLSAYLFAVAYASVVTFLGLGLLLFSEELRLPGSEFPTVHLGGSEFPQAGSRLVFSMAFLGMYLSGLQQIFRRYALNDLSPTVYYGLGIRITFAGTLVLVIYNAYAALSGGHDSQGGITANIWPAFAFLTGLFPDRGLKYLLDRAPWLSAPSDAVRPAPLEMIEGIGPDNVVWLGELGIDTCYDLANADFVPLLLRTPYSARQLIDWILQAKLCVYFSDSMKDLRHCGIRTIVDLANLTDEELATLPSDTSVTAKALQRAHDTLGDGEMQRLCEVGRLLGTFANREGLPSSHLGV